MKNQKSLKITKIIAIIFVIFVTTACNGHKNPENNRNTYKTNNLPHIFTQNTTKKTNTLQSVNILALNAIASNRVNPPQASRLLALVNVAMFQAINAENKTYTNLFPIIKEKPANYNAEVAAVGAGLHILRTYFEGFYTLWEKEEQFLTETWKNTLEKQDYEVSLAYGKHIGQKVFSERSADGWNHYQFHEPSQKNGQWRPTTPYFEESLEPYWGNIKPLVLPSANQITVSPPPALDSPQFKAEMKEVEEIGGILSKRTANQTNIAHFWADAKGTYTPAGKWVKIALQELQKSDKEYSLVQKSHLLAVLTTTLMDAGIACWHAKYQHNFWRPIDAINEKNNKAEPNPDFWYSLIENPNFPEHPSGHSVFSGAAAHILTTFFGENHAFSATSLALGEKKRTFSSFNTAAKEAAESRIFGGIHFRSASDQGLTMGKEIANYVKKNVFLPVKD